MRFKWLVAVCFLTLMIQGAAQSTMDDDQVPLSYLQSVTPQTGRLNAAGGGGALGTRSYGDLLGIDTVTNWSSYFYLPGAVPTAGGDYPQFTWPYSMVGNSPMGKGDDGLGRTTIGAPIIPVIVDLRNADGSPRFVNGHRLISDPTALLLPLLKSPVFSNTTYDSSLVPTQFTDAVQKAEFQSVPGWHTLLKPRIATTRTMVLIRGTYRFALDASGNLAYVLVDSGVFGSLLFPPTPNDTSTVIGAAENAGDLRTKDIGTFFFNNTYLYNQTPTGIECCILGYHSYDLEPGDAGNGWRERRYVMNYSSWISPGLFGSAFQDVTAVSHEMAELFNDPFVNNATPIWVAPNGLCQNNLETGDVIEGLPNATYPISMNGFLYHPQNEALLQWFASQSPSSAIDQAYSYPDTTVLTSPSISMFSDCATPFSLSKAKPAGPSVLAH